MRRTVALVLSLFVLAGASACGGNHDKAGNAGSDKLANLKVTGKFATQPTVSVGKGVKVTKPVSEVISKGTGGVVQKDKYALFQVDVVNGATGKTAVSTYTQAPLSKQMSSTAFFASLVNAMVGQPKGSRIAVAAPVKSVWGTQDESSIGLKSADTAVFVIDILSVEPTDVLNAPGGTTVAPPASAPKVVEKSGVVTGIDWSKVPKKPPTKLTVIPLVKGDGPKAQAGSLVTFNYYGAVWGANKAFDSSFSRGAPTPFAVGVHGLIPAWDNTIPGLARGSRVLIIAPPSTAYGSQAQQNIPANSTLVFVVDILGVDNS